MEANNDFRKQNVFLIIKHKNKNQFRSFHSLLMRKYQLPIPECKKPFLLRTLCFFIVVRCTIRYDI